MSVLFDMNEYLRSRLNNSRCVSDKACLQKPITAFLYFQNCCVTFVPLRIGRSQKYQFSMHF